MYVVTDGNGKLVRPGDTVTSFRGEPGVFQLVSRGPQYNGTAKVIVDGREYYDRVWHLTVVDPSDAECNCSNPYCQV